MRTELGIKVFAEVMQAVDHYNSLPNHFTQLDTRQTEKLEAFWSKLYGEDKNKRWEKVQACLNEWLTPNIHIIKQTWPSTACGWGGMGGAMITSDYTVVIENVWAGFIAVYYGGQLAYIAEVDNKMNEFIKEDYRDLPGFTKCESLLTIVYKKIPWERK